MTSARITVTTVGVGEGADAKVARRDRRGSATAGTTSPNDPRHRSPRSSPRRPSRRASRRSMSNRSRPQVRPDRPRRWPTSTSDNSSPLLARLRRHPGQADQRADPGVRGRRPVAGLVAVWPGNERGLHLGRQDRGGRPSGSPGRTTASSGLRSSATRCARRDQGGRRRRSTTRTGHAKPCSPSTRSTRPAGSSTRRRPELIRDRRRRIGKQKPGDGPDRARPVSGRRSRRPAGVVPPGILAESRRRAGPLSAVARSGGGLSRRVAAPGHRTRTCSDRSPGFRAAGSGRRPPGTSSSPGRADGAGGPTPLWPISAGRRGRAVRGRMSRSGGSTSA